MIISGKKAGNVSDNDVNKTNKNKIVRINK